MLARQNTYGYGPVYQGSLTGAAASSRQPTNIPVSDLLVTASVTVRVAIAR